MRKSYSTVSVGVSPEFCAEHNVENLRELDNLLQQTQGVQNRNVQLVHATKIVELMTSTGVEGARRLTQALSQQQLPKLTDCQLSELVHWLSSLLKQSELDASLYTALAALLKAYIQCADRELWRLLLQPKHSTLLERMRQEEGREVRLAVVQTLDILLSGLLESATLMEDLDLQICEEVAYTLLTLHYKLLPPCNDISQAGVFALSTLRVLTKICTLSSIIAQAHVTEFFGLAKMFMLYGLEAIAAPLAPQKVLPSQQAIYDAAEEAAAVSAAVGAQARSCGGRLATTRKPKTLARGVAQKCCDSKDLSQFVDLGCSDWKTSDSEPSEAEGVNGSCAPKQRQRLDGKVRLAAITLLGIVARAQERHHIYGYWHALFPTHSNANRDDLLFVAQRDPNVRCRCAALQVATQLIYGAKSFLEQAESATSALGQHNTPAFLPFAQHLGLLVLASYEALTVILTKEAAYPALTQALKTLAVLVQATPFKRLEVGFIRRFVEQVRPLVHHRDATIQVAALMVMEFLVALPELTPEIAEVIGLPHPQHQLHKVSTCLEQEELSSDNEDNPSTITTSCSTHAAANASWLLLRILQNIESLEVKGRLPSTLLIASLQVLNALATHFTLLQPQLERVAAALESVLLCNLGYEVRRHAAQCLKNCAHHMSNWLLSQSTSSTSYDHNAALCERFWLQLLPCVMQQFDEGPQQEPQLWMPVGVALCDALSNMGVVVYERLPHATQMKLVSFLSCTGSDSSAVEANDHDSMVHAAAVRALAVYALFPILRADFVFIENAAELALRLVSSRNLHVRVKAFWALGNISDALVLELASGASVSDDLLRRLVTAGIKACADNDKVRCNAVRLLGNLLRLFSAQQLQDNGWRALQLQATTKLSHTCIRGPNSAKTKWNACYAIGTLLRNPALFSDGRDDWQPDVYDTLCEAIVHDANFKVRINATVAMQSLAQREHFSPHFELFWRSLLAAIEQSYNLDNFYEYNHRDKLQEQLCLAICHVLRLAEAEDFPMLRKHLTERLEMVQQTWLRVSNRMVPETAAPLMTCSTLLLQNITPNVCPAQSSAIQFIAQVFSTR